MGERIVGCAPKGATTSQLCLSFHRHFTATRFFRRTPAGKPLMKQSRKLRLKGDPRSHTKNHETQNRTKSIPQLVLKKEASNLNRRSAVDGRTDEQRANHAALAIDVRVDTANAFAA